MIIGEWKSEHFKRGDEVTVYGQSVETGEMVPAFDGVIDAVDINDRLIVFSEAIGEKASRIAQIVDHKGECAECARFNAECDFR